MASKKKSQPLAWEHIAGYKSAQYVRIYISMIDSPAWKHLPGTAKNQYITLKRQYRGGLMQTDGRGNVVVKCPYKDLRAAGIKSNATISKNFMPLEAFGFIEIKGGGFHVASEYKFSDKWKDITDEEAKNIKRKLKEHAAIS